MKMKSPKNHHILMGDVIRSRDQEGDVLISRFQALVDLCNKRLGGRIKSPLTITLGDEFQGVVDSFKTAAESVLFMEEEILKQGFPLKLRYVSHFGPIDSEINPERAHGMLGAGLTKARELLVAGKKEKSRILFSPDTIQHIDLANNLFFVATLIIDRWKVEDYGLIHDMITSDDNEQVGGLHGMNASQVWKRRKTLEIKEYQLVKQTILSMAGQADE